MMHDALYSRSRGPIGAKIAAAGHYFCIVGTHMQYAPACIGAERSVALG